MLDASECAVTDFLININAGEEIGLSKICFKLKLAKQDPVIHGKERLASRPRLSCHHQSGGKKNTPSLSPTRLLLLSLMLSSPNHGMFCLRKKLLDIISNSIIVIYLYLNKHNLLSHHEKLCGRAGGGEDQTEVWGH